MPPEPTLPEPTGVPLEPTLPEPTGVPLEPALPEPTGVPPEPTLAPRPIRCRTPGLRPQDLEVSPVFVCVCRQPLHSGAIWGRDSFYLVLLRACLVHGCVPNARGDAHLWRG